MTPNERDAGLVRTVGPWGLAASIVNIVVGAGIFAVPAAMAASMGPYAFIAFLVGAVAIGAVAVCFAEGGSRLPTSGGAYGYVVAAFGPLTGYIAGTMLWLSSVLACGGVAAALGDVAGSLCPPAYKSALHAVVIVGVIGGIALVNLGGVARGVRLVTAATVLKLIPLATFVIVGAGAVHRSNFEWTVQPGTADLGRALILALFAFTGMETSLCASGEVERPARTIPRALVIALATVTILYVSIQYISQGILGPSLTHSTVPLADAMGMISPALRLLMLVGAAASMAAWIGSDILGTPRMLFAFGRDGLLPRVRQKSDAPHRDHVLRNARDWPRTDRNVRRTRRARHLGICRAVYRRLCRRVATFAYRRGVRRRASELPLAGYRCGDRDFQHAGADPSGVAR
jgi:amino acid transporter